MAKSVKTQEQKVAAKERKRFDNLMLVYNVQPYRTERGGEHGPVMEEVIRCPKCGEVQRADQARMTDQFYRCWRSTCGAEFTSRKLTRDVLEQQGLLAYAYLVPA